MPSHTLDLALVLARDPADQLASLEFWGRVIAAAFLFAFGACVGSFLNVLVYRLPAGLSVVTPPSRCPICGHRLAWHENLPVIGWLRLRGRCSACKTPISIQYPLIEAAIGVLFAGLYLLYFTVPESSPLAAIGGPWWKAQGFAYAWPTFMAVAFLLTALIAMTLIDARTFTIPIELSTAVILLGLGAALLQPLMPTGYRAAGLWPVSLPLWKGTGLGIGGLLGTGVALGLLRKGLVTPSFLDFDQYVKEGDDLASYPHARREMRKELAFLLPIVVGMAVGFFVGSVLGSSGDAKPPLLLRSIGASGIGFLVGGGLLWALRIGGTYLFNREAMGMGDVHLLAGVGAVLGWQDATWTLFLTPAFALTWVGVRVAVGAVLGRRWMEIPLGPFLAAAAFFRVLAHPWIDRAFETYVLYREPLF
jgi:leader peptidase (prepilin peptidase)/N-methyltransferase